jgi:L-ribulokinase
MMVARGYAIGLDFGTASARTLLLDLATGEEAAVSELAYEHGVVDDVLPSTGERLPVDWALFDPTDYTGVLEAGVKAVLAERPGAAEQVIGIGLDATSCTVVPLTAAGEPLCTLEQWARRPHAWPKLWKHHAAQPVASRLNDVAEGRGEKWLARYGGRISSEWYFPKLIEVWLEDREAYDAMAAFAEVTDWLVWQLTGRERRSACPAAYKALWSAGEGIPPADFFEAAYPGFSRPAEKLGSTFYPLGSSAGNLSPEWAARLGLRPTVKVAVGNVDSFVSFPGTGAGGAGKWVMVVGTSICDMVVDLDEVLLAGITGVAKEGILPGLYGYEAGQPAVGDMLAWFAEVFTRTGLSANFLGEQAQGQPAGVAGGGAGIAREPAGAPGLDAARRLSGLESSAARLAPASTGLVALDWWNGNRSVLADADLTGVIAGLTLQTSAVEVYRALLESVAFGNLVILDNFRDNGFSLDEIVACGGIAEKSPLMMQLFADTSGLPVTVPASQQVPARGSALFGAVAAGAEAGGFSSISEASKALAPGAARTYKPDRAAAVAYGSVFKIWKRLHDVLGREERAWLHELKGTRRR